MDVNADFIQFLDDNAEAYIWATYEDGKTYPALKGWWDSTDVGGTPLDEQEIANGTGFLLANGSGNAITFAYAGQVVTGYDCTMVIPAGTGSPFVCNMTPSDITLSQVTADGMDVNADFFQWLDAEYAEAYVWATYEDGKTYPALKGWWDSTDVGGTPLDDQEWKAGEAILGAIGSGNEITITIPDPIK